MYSGTSRYLIATIFKMDATKRPLLIPPDFATYAETHGVFDMYKRLMEQLIVNKPEDPLSFMANLLKQDNDNIPQIIILGPPASGKRTIAKLVASKLRAAHLTTENMISEADADTRKEAQSYLNSKQPIPTELWVKIVKSRLSFFDCVRKGWVIDGFPQTSEQAKALQAEVIYPKHCILLDSPDTVLIERAAGKRIDPKTGDIYHITFDWPNNPDIEMRLEEVPGCTGSEVMDRLVTFHRNIDSLITSYKHVIKTINADQPKGDVFAQAFTFLCSEPRSHAPHNPRVILLGPTGSGKGVQAALLANKYNIVNVSCGQLIRQAIVDETKAGLAAKPYVDKTMLVPDAIIMNILRDRLSQLDCVSRGWVLHGYPKTRDQAEQLVTSGFIPNRVFFLNVPNDSVVERLTLRSTDPVTGERYHSLYNPPRTQEVKDRLERNPKDSEEEVMNRLSQYSAFTEELEDFYVDGQKINADQDPHTVFECLESMIVNPLPHNYDN